MLNGCRNKNIPYLCVNPINGFSDVLENAVVTHEEVPKLNTLRTFYILIGVTKKVHETGNHVYLWEVKQSIHDIYARFVQVDELVGVQLVHFRPVGEEQKLKFSLHVMVIIMCLCLFHIQQFQDLLTAPKLIHKIIENTFTFQKNAFNTTSKVINNDNQIHLHTHKLQISNSNNMTNL